MSKKVKMVLYGEPGVGKSVFALKAPKPFFITTDGNYEWLEEFGAKEKDHLQVYSWEEAKKAFKNEYEDYETIVVDLLEDMFKWCEYEFCKSSRIDHVSDISYGKGYDITRNEFFIEISKLLAKDKNIILIMHGTDKIVKDRRGIEKTCHIPSPRLPDKLLDMIEGRVRYFLRCYLKAEETDDGKLIKKRYLSVVPKENEFGIIRGINENSIPHDIPLEFSEFAKVIGLEMPIPTKAKIKVEKTKEYEEVVKEEPKQEVIEQPTLELEVKEEPVKVEEREIDVKGMVATEDRLVVEESPATEPTKPLTNEEKRQQILAKLAALKK